MAGHDPSTHSLVDRHKMSEAAKPSSSFPTIPEASAGEEEGEERRRLSESESSSESSFGRKRAREKQSSETSSSSSEEDDETSMRSKRSRTESSGSSKIGSFLSQLLNPFSWGKKNTSASENDSDGIFVDAKEEL